MATRPPSVVGPDAAPGPGRGRSAGAAGRLALLIPAVALLAAACNDPFSSPTREEARPVLTADRDVSVRVVTSTNFAVTSTGDGDSNVALDDSTVRVVEHPWDRTFDIRETRRFYVRAEPTDTESVNATLELFIDGESRGTVSGDLQEQPLEHTFASVEQ